MILFVNSGYNYPVNFLQFYDFIRKFQIELSLIVCRTIQLMLLLRKTSWCVG